MSFRAASERSREITCFYSRAGADDPLALALAISKVPILELRGLYSFSGHSYACNSLAELSECFYRERKQLRALKAEIEKAGVTVEEISVGCTPIALAFGAEKAGEMDELEWEGITEGSSPSLGLWADLALTTVRL